VFFECWVGEHQFQEENHPENHDGRASHQDDERQSEPEEDGNDSEEYSQVEVAVKQGDIDALYRIMASLDIQVGTDAPEQRSRKKKKKKATRAISRSRSRRRRKKRRSSSTSSSRERAEDVHLGEDPPDLTADPYPVQESPVYEPFEGEDDISLARDLQSWLNA